MKNVDWDTLIPELKGWNNGNGIDPETWVGCEGSFRLAAAYSLIFWPEFTEIDGMIFRGNMDRETLASWMQNCSGDRRSVEATANHIHILDLHYVGAPDANADRIIFLGNVLKEIYRVKLAAEFPNRDIVVEFYEPPDKELQDYQLTFYQGPGS
jgi:hypothetical protein